MYALSELVSNDWGQETSEKFDCNFRSEGPNVGAMFSYTDMVYAFSNQLCVKKIHNLTNPSGNADRLGELG